MVYRVLRIDDEISENSIQCYVNKNERIILAQPDENGDFYITLSKHEANQLAIELRRLIKQL